MSEKIKKHLDVTFISVIGLILAITGIIGISSMVPQANNAEAAVATTVVVTATVSEWITFTASATSVTITPALVNTAGVAALGTSNVVTFTSGTNAGGGFSVTVGNVSGKLSYGATSSILSGSPSSTIVAGTDGYGIQASSTALTVAPIYKYWANDIVGTASSTAQTLVSTTSPASGILTDARFKAAAITTKAAGAYTDTVTFTMTGAY